MHIGVLHPAREVPFVTSDGKIYMSIEGNTHRPEHSAHPVSTDDKGKRGILPEGEDPLRIDNGTPYLLE